MFTIKQPNHIIFGNDTARNFQYPNNSLIITSKGAKNRKWLDYLNLDEDFEIFDQVENNPSMYTVNKIIEKFSNVNISCVIGLGGGSCLDVAKYVGYKLKKKKILIPTTFGSGSEVTRISVLTVNGIKKSFHDDEMFADVAIVDPYFIKNSPMKIIKNSAIDACAQCSEGFDSKSGNEYTKYLCNTAFDILENAILNKKYEDLAMGSLIAGLGFGNCSTTLGHALSYVFSNEGYSHGHALAYTTFEAHKFNSSIFTERFDKIRKELKFEEIFLKEDVMKAAKTILVDRRHLDNNPKLVTEKNLTDILKKFKRN